MYLGKFDNNSFNTIYAGKVFIPIKTAMTVIPQQSMIINGTGGNSTSGGGNSVSTPIIINGIGDNSSSSGSSSGSGSSRGALFT